MTHLLLEYDESVDAAYLTVSDYPWARQERLDDARAVNYAADGSVIGIELLSPRRKGVLVDGLPFDEDVARVLRTSGFDIRRQSRSPAGHPMTLEILHREAAAGTWLRLSLMEQLGNIGTEVARAMRAKEAGNTARSANALRRALELFDLTIADDRWRGPIRREVCRAREVVCDYLAGDNVYRSTTETLDRYFLAFGLAARRSVAES